MFMDALSFLEGNAGSLVIANRASRNPKPTESRYGQMCLYSKGT